MTARRLLLALLLAIVPGRAFAQLDDLLAPLTPKKEAPKKHNSKRRHRTHVRESRKEPPPAHEDLIAPLVPSTGKLVVKLSGPGAEPTVRVDGREVKAGATLEVDAGEHLVVVKRPGYADFSRRVKVAPGDTVEVPAVMDATEGVLTVTADVPGSTVIVDGRELGEVPQQNVLLPPGMHEVIVRREGFEDHVSKLSVRAGREYMVSGALTPAERTTTLMASNGDRPERPRLVPDSTEVTQTLPGGDTEQQAEAPGWYQRWYVWAGVGAVVAAGVTSAVVVTQNNGRSLTPEEVCGGRCDDVINAPKAFLQRGFRLSVGTKF